MVINTSCIASPLWLMLVYIPLSSSFYDAKVAVDDLGSLELLGLCLFLPSLFSRAVGFAEAGDKQEQPSWRRFLFDVWRLKQSLTIVVYELDSSAKEPVVAWRCCRFLICARSYHFEQSGCAINQGVVSRLIWWQHRSGFKWLGECDTAGWYNSSVTLRLAMILSFPL